MIDGEVSEPVHFLFVKGSGSLGSGDPNELMNVYSFESIVEIEQLLLGQINSL